MLGTLRRQWAPQAFVVSFKLETDADILVKKVSNLATVLCNGCPPWPIDSTESSMAMLKFEPRSSLL